MRIIGSRRCILVDSIKPFVAAVFGVFIFDEPITVLMVLGVVATSVGVLIVALERTDAAGDKHAIQLDNLIDSVQHFHVLQTPARSDEPPPPVSEPPRVLEGYVWAVLNVGFDVYGAVLIKQTAAALTAVQIAGFRFITAAIMLVAICSVVRCASREGDRWLYANSHLPTLTRRSWGFILLGVLLCAVCNTTLTSYAVFHVDLAVFATLASLTPVYSLPLVVLLKGERISPRAVFGSCLAVLGVFPLYLTLE